MGTNWDYKLGILNYFEQFSSIKGGKAGLAINLLDASTNRPIEAEAYLTMSTSSLIKMVPESTYVGQLDHTSSFILY